MPQRGRDEVSVLARSFQSHDGATGEPARAPGAKRARGRVARVGPSPCARAQRIRSSRCSLRWRIWSARAICPRRSSTRSSTRAPRHLRQKSRISRPSLAASATSAKCPSQSWSGSMPKDVIERVRALYETAAGRDDARIHFVVQMSPMRPCRSTPTRSCCTALSRTWC